MLAKSDYFLLDYVYHSSLPLHVGVFCVIDGSSELISPCQVAGQNHSFLHPGYLAHSRLHIHPILMEFTESCC